MREQLINVPASGNAPVAVSATTFATRVEIIEDGSGTAAGLNATFPDDNFTTAYQYPPGQQPIVRGVDQVTGAPGRSPLIGKPSRTVPVVNGNGAYTNLTEAATIYCKVVSMGGATAVRVIERP